MIAALFVPLSQCSRGGKTNAPPPPAKTGLQKIFPRSDAQTDYDYGATRIAPSLNGSLTLVAFANDPDNLPARRGAGRGQTGGAAAQPGGQRGEQPGAANPPAPVFRPSSSLAARSGPGLRLSWMVYRGKAATVTFSPDQLKTWMDTRVYSNSPWSPPYNIPEPPPDGKWVTQATFQEPGTYVLRAVASDGSLFTYDNVTVSVTR